MFAAKLIEIKVLRWLLGDLILNFHAIKNDLESFVLKLF